jgi:hypothetical protein
MSNSPVAKNTVVLPTEKAFEEAQVLKWMLRTMDIVAERLYVTFDSPSGSLAIQIDAGPDALALGVCLLAETLTDKQFEAKWLDFSTRWNALSQEEALARREKSAVWEKKVEMAAVLSVWQVTRGEAK